MCVAHREVRIFCAAMDRACENASHWRFEAAVKFSWSHVANYESLDIKYIELTFWDLRLRRAVDALSNAGVKVQGVRLIENCRTNCALRFHHQKKNTPQY